MPPGPPRRKPAKKKKKKAKRSTAPHPRLGESDSDLHNSPHPLVNVDDMEDSSSGYESLTADITQRAAKDKQGKIQIDKRPNLTAQAKTEIDEAAMVEPASVADYLSQPFVSSSPEKGPDKVEDLGFKTPPTGGPATPVGQSLVEVASQLNNISNIQEKDDFIAAETRLEPTVINKTDSKNDQLLKENEVQKSGSESNKTSPKSEENLLQDSTNGKCPYCGRSSDDRVIEPATPDCSERQPLLAAAPPPSEKASWKNCCGIFELFSGSTSIILRVYKTQPASSPENQHHSYGQHHFAKDVGDDFSRQYYNVLRHFPKDT